MLLLAKEELKSHQDATNFYILLKMLKQILLKIKMIEILETIAILQLNTEEQDI